MEVFIRELAEQGVGYLLAVIEGFVIFWLFGRLEKRDKDVQVLQEKIGDMQETRVKEAKEYSEQFVGVGKDMVGGMSALKESQQSLVRFIEQLPFIKK